MLRAHLSTKPGLAWVPNYGHPQMRGLVGWWLFREGGGDTVRDLSLSRNDGTHRGTGTKWGVGRRGVLGDFNGTDDYLDIVGSPAELTLTGDMTVTCRVRFRAVANDAAWVVWGASGETEATNFLYVIDMMSTGDVLLGHEYSTGSNQFNTFNTNLSTNTDYMLTAVRDDSALTWSLYIDGVLFGTPYTYTNSASGGTSATLNIGRSMASLTHTDSLIDDVRIYNRAHSQSEILDLYLRPYASFDRKIYIPASAAAPGAGAVSVLESQKLSRVSLVGI